MAEKKTHVCWRCKKRRKLTSFHPSSLKHFDWICKKCVNEKARNYYRRNRDAIRAQQKAAYWSNLGEKRRQLVNNFRRQKYGIEPEEYDRLCKVVNYTCPICKRSKNQLKRALAVDHDHKTGRIRGVLCCNCNAKLGWYEKHRISMLKYLKRNKK